MQRFKIAFWYPNHNVLSDDHSQTLKNDNKHSKVTPFVLDKVDSRDIYIRKTTAVWLLQEGEKLSTDRLLRVRATQPFGSTVSTSLSMKVLQHHEETPIVDEKKECKGVSADVTEDSIGVLCA